MPIEFISSFVFKENNFGIGYKGDLLCRVPEDLANFKTMTMGHFVIMGRKTWDSLSVKPLPGRTNIVLSKTKTFTVEEDTFFMTFGQLKHLIDPAERYFVIGGQQIFKLFMDDADFYPKRLFLTHIKTKVTDVDTWLGSSFLDNYKLTGFSQELTSKTGVKYQYLYYNFSQERSQEYSYLGLMKQILNSGNHREDRTGTGTISLFGTSLRFDISESIPLLTTKRVPFGVVIKELLWFLRGDTDAKILQNQGVKIWDGNTSREFLDKRGLNHYPEGVLGAGYGWQIRHQGASYDQKFADTSKFDSSEIGGVDQLEYIVNLLKTDPFSRRIMMSYWNPSDFDKTALLPCHFSCQFYVELNKNGQKELSCQFTMRSTDGLLGLPVNLVSYSVLTYILAKKCDMIPKEIIFIGGDTHIYKNHVLQVTEQLTRKVRSFPCLSLDDSIKHKDWYDINPEDFDIFGYFSHPSIKAPMAI